jgi:hypothetical protein
LATVGAVYLLGVAGVVAPDCCKAGQSTGRVVAPFPSGEAGAVVSMRADR